MKRKLYIAVGLLLARISLAQFSGLPIPDSTHTWDQANASVGVCSQLLEAVTERCMAVGTNVVTAPQIVQSFTVSWGTSNAVVTTNWGTNSITYTNRCLIYTNITTTNCSVSFNYTDSTGTTHIVHPPVTRAFIAALDSKITDLLPHFVSTNGHDAGTGFTTWFKRSYTNEDGSIEHPSDFPMLNFVEACQSASIGHVVTASTDIWQHVSGGEAYYTRQPAVTSWWPIAEASFGRVAGRTITNGGVVAVDSNAYWQTRSLGEFNTRFYDASIKPVAHYLDGTNTTYPAVTFTATGYVLDQSSQVTVPETHTYTTSGTSTVLNAIWYSISDIASSTVAHTGAVISIGYPQYVLYGDQSFVLHKADINERVKVLKQMVWTKNENVSWTNTVYGSVTNDSIILNESGTHTQSLDHSSGSRSAWEGYQASPYCQLGWWTMTFTDLSGGPWFAWLKYPYASTAVAAATPTNNQAPSLTIEGYGDLTCSEQAWFGSPVFGGGDPLGIGNYTYYGTMNHHIENSQVNTRYNAKMALTDLPSNMAHQVEWYVYEPAKLGTDPVEYFQTGTLATGPALSDLYAVTATVAQVDMVGTVGKFHELVIAGEGEKWATNCFDFYGSVFQTETYDSRTQVVITAHNKEMRADQNWITIAGFSDIETPTFAPLSQTTYTTGGVAVINCYGANDEIMDITLKVLTNNDLVVFTGTNGNPIGAITATFYFDPAKSTRPTWNGTTGTASYYGRGSSKFAPSIENTSDNPYQFAYPSVPYSPNASTSVLSTYVTRYGVDTNSMIEYDAARTNDPTYQWLSFSNWTTLVTSQAYDTVYVTNWWAQSMYDGSPAYTYESGHLSYNNTNTTTSTATNWAFTSMEVTNKGGVFVQWIRDGWDTYWYVGDDSAGQSGSYATNDTFVRDAFPAIIKWDVSGGLKRY